MAHSAPGSGLALSALLGTWSLMRVLYFLELFTFLLPEGSCGETGQMDCVCASAVSAGYDGSNGSSTIDRYTLRWWKF